MHGLRSLKMLMAWRNLQQKSFANTILKTLVSSVGLCGSITFIGPLEHGRVVSNCRDTFFICQFSIFKLTSFLVDLSRWYQIEISLRWEDRGRKKRNTVSRVVQYEG